MSKANEHMNRKSILERKFSSRSRRPIFWRCSLELSALRHSLPV